MRHLFLAAAGAALIPLAAQAQINPDARIEEAQRRLQALEQNQRIDQVQRQVDDLDYRVRTAENIRQLDEQRAQVRSNIPPPPPQTYYSNSRPITQAELKAAEERRAASLAASEARLKALGAEQTTPKKKNKDK